MRRHFLLVLAGLLTALLLAACTGTTEQQPSILLAVGYTDTTVSPNVPHVALVEDTFGPAGASPNRFKFLADSVRALPATPVAEDVVQRGSARGTLVVLSRNDSSSAHTGYLSFFNLADIDPDAPTAFKESRNPITISLSALGNTASFPTLTGFCPTGVQVSADGDYVALLSDNSANGPCANTGTDAIDIIQVNSNPPREIAHLDTVSGGPVMVSSFYLDQTQSPGVLYYFIRTASGARLQAYDLNPNNSNPESDLGVTVPLSNPAVDVIPDLGAQGSSLIALRDSSFVPINSYASANIKLGAAVNLPVGGNTKLILDDFQSLPEVLVLSSSYLTVALNNQDKSPKYTSVSAVDGTLEPLTGFGYLLGSQSLILFDVQTYGGGGSTLSNTLAYFSLPQLTRPAFITWAVAGGGVSSR
jgi:hypothetical protein